jgi:hypothetical protein
MLAHLFRLKGGLFQHIHLGPTCKKMMDLKAPDKVFKAAAFEPSDEDVQNYKRNQRNPKTVGSDVSSKRSAGFAADIPDELVSDSDDDLPDVANMLDRKKDKDTQKANVTTSDDESDVRLFRGHC